MPAPIKLAILIDTLPGRGEEQVQAFAALAPRVRAEKGCLAYQLHRVPGQDDRFVLTESWASAADLAAHNASEHMQDAAPWLASFRAGPVTVLPLQEVHPAPPPAAPKNNNNLPPFLISGILLGSVLAALVQRYWPLGYGLLAGVGGMLLMQRWLQACQQRGWLPGRR
ncbi:putative quinol monooxygenase [Vogesella urethralis]|uniref:putative quinol monooxygenase n=1 Tax=Vogesella urethralis TaxID=2592656 RepID=UPI00118480F4|nr:putative quinol monooxygenase [Vogesella urethralis]